MSLGRRCRGALCKHNQALARALTRRAAQAELSAANERHAKAMVRMQQQVEEAKVSQREQDVFWDEYAAQVRV